jgi:hypothetical protein
MSTPRSAAWVCCAALLSAALCVACEPEDHRVPFGLDREGHGADEDRREDTVEDEPFEARSASDLPRGRTYVEVAGARLSVASSSSAAEIGAVLDVDFEGDGDRDALAVLRGDRALELVAATREERAYTVSSLSRFELPEGCTAGAARIDQVTERGVLARLGHTCATGASETTWAVELARRPRVREVIRVLPGAEGAPPVAVAPAVRDIDGDGREDLEASVTVGAYAPVVLAWLDRPGGFSLNREEPAATIRRLVSEAGERIESAPDEATAKADEALGLFAALCKESGAPRLSLGEAPGVQCALGTVPLEASAIRVAVQVRKGELLPALEAEGALRRTPGFETVARGALASAWSSVAAPEGLTSRVVLESEALGGRSAALASLFFADDETLVVRGPLTRRVTLAADPAVEVTIDPGPPIRDAQGVHAVLDVRRRCDVVRATIAAASAVSHPVDAVTAVSEPVIASAPVVPGERCSGFVAVEPPYEFTVLGWAPQGLVAARLGAVRVVPLTVDARPAGDPEDLSPGTPLPAPLRGALVTPEGSAYVLPSPHGVLRIARTAEPSVELWRAPAWTTDEPIHAVAIAPNGRRVAAWRGGAIWLLER